MIKKTNQSLFQNNDFINDIKLADNQISDLVNKMKGISRVSIGAKIELINICKRYEGNDKNTLDNINLTIEAEKFCVFLGPSGCGKTTLLRMIAGLNSITSGSLLFNGKRYNNLSPPERNVAMVFQSYALYPHMNVYNNISFGLRIANERKDIIDRRVKDAAKILKIENHLYSKPKDLSGGQRQRVAIGRAIVRKPSVFLMDEPLSNLDAKLRESMRRELVNLHRMLNTTSIYVTHDQLEAMTMGDQIVVLNNGTIQQNGTAKELYFQPCNVFIAKFIGSPTMNLYNGKIINKQFIFGDNDQLKINLPLNIINKIPHKQKIILGFRSEDVVINTTSDFGIEGVIFNIQSLGREQSIVIQVQNDLEIIATIPNNIDYELYQKVYLTFNLERVHIFDETTEKRIN